ncbi:hypothetical protein MCOR25_008580 [Pyricularia grisea]|nr:hypothetical protein MCOR25_008580 [Pyricularia grisea]
MVFLLPYKPSTEAARAELRLARLALRMHASKTDLRFATEDQKKQYARLLNANVCKYSSEDKIYKLILRATLLSWELRNQARADIQAVNAQKPWLHSDFHKQPYEELEIKFKYTKAPTHTCSTQEIGIAPPQISTGANMELCDKLAKASIRAVPNSNDRKIEDVTLWIQSVEATRRTGNVQDAAHADAARAKEGEKL